MIPQPKPLKYGRGGKCDICGARGPLTEVSLPSKRHPVMVCIRCYRNIQMRYLFSKKDFDEDDEFQDKWRAENYSFENSVEQMLAVAYYLGSVKSAREHWGAAPQVWEEVTRRFNESFDSSNYTNSPNCNCGATLQWSQKKRAWYCVECPFNTFKDAESFEAEDKYTQNIKNYGHKKWRHKGRNRPDSDATVGKKLEGFKLKPKCTALRSDGFVCGKPIQWDRRDLGDLCGTHHRQMQKREAKDQAEASKHRKEPYDYGPLLDWAEKQDFSAEDRPEEERMTRPQAEALATKMIGLLQPSCEFIEVCGSFRRGREDPGDLDIVVILKPRETLPKIVEDLEGEHTAVNWLGEKKTQIIVDGVKVDIRVTTDRAKGAALLYFTGPAGYNIGIRRAAKSRGMKLNEYGIWTRDTNEYLGGATEEEIYAVLGKNFRPATERRAETITRQLWEISDGELRWLYKNGKITKAQMHIGIGAKMDAEELQEFNSAVIFPSSYRNAGPLEKAVINNVMMAEIRMQEALLTLETNIKMGLISEQEALKTFMKIVG